MGKTQDGIITNTKIPTRFGELKKYGLSTT